MKDHPMPPCDPHTDEDTGCIPDLDAHTPECCIRRAVNLTRIYGNIAAPLRQDKGYWTAGDGQPCPAVTVVDATGKPLLSHDCKSAVEEAFIEWAVEMWNRTVQNDQESSS